MKWEMNFWVKTAIACTSGISMAIFTDWWFINWEFWFVAISVTVILACFRTT